tara:strand:- start:885 stop:1586 length:702 start_codon:yes stop_codon:yes gene_type:complete
MNKEPISILVPTYNRHKFLPLFLMNLKSQTYPHHLLTIIIDDDGQDKFIKDIPEFEKAIEPMKLEYITNKPKRTIGKKRDDLIKKSKAKICCFFDDDDIYFPEYIDYSYHTLKHNKVGCVGSNKMIFCMSDRDFNIHAIDCGDAKKLIHEATIMLTKKWYRASCGFENSSQGEGATIFQGHERNVSITDINKVMCCLQHGSNTINKLQFAKPDNQLPIDLSDDMIDLLRSILK